MGEAGIAIAALIVGTEVGLLVAWYQANRHRDFTYLPTLRAVEKYAKVDPYLEWDDDAGYTKHLEQHIFALQADARELASSINVLVLIGLPFAIFLGPALIALIMGWGDVLT